MSGLLFARLCLAGHAAAAAAPPPATTPIAPTGLVSSTRLPEFKWLRVESATQHRLYVARGESKHYDGYLGATNAWKPAAEFPVGQYRWWVQTANAAGTGPWSAEARFEIPLPLPGMVHPLAPVGTCTNALPRFSWSEMSKASHYRLWVNRGSAKHLEKWIEGTTTWGPDEPFPPGSYTWWVQTANPDGPGPWSPAASFAIEYAGAVPPVPSSPVGRVHAYGRWPWEFVWKGDPYASWARFIFTRNGTNFLDGWVSLRGGYSRDKGGAWTYGRPRHVWSLGRQAGFPPGDYTWRVQEWRPGSGSGPLSAPAAFLVRPCVSPPPAVAGLDAQDEFWPLRNQGYTNCPRPRLTWDFTPEAAWYRILLDRNGAPYGTVWAQHAWRHGWRSPNDLPTGRYAFRVNAWNELGYGTSSTASAAFTVQYAAPGPVLDVRAEQEGGRLVASGRILPHTYWYHLWVNRNGTPFTNRWVDLDAEPEAVAEDGRFVLRFPQSLPAGQYDLWMRSWNGQGYGAWSAQVRLTVPPLTAPVLVGPAGTVAALRPSFCWKPVSGAEAYRIYVQKDGKLYFDKLVEQIYTFAETRNGITFAAGGIAQGWHGDDEFWPLPIPFAFPFCGATYTQLFVNSNGGVTFGQGEAAPLQAAAAPALPAIAAFGADLTTDAAGDDVYVVSDPSCLTIRWKARYAPTEGEVNAAVSLYPDGRILIRYGNGNQAGAPVIGLSAGGHAWLHLCAAGGSGSLDRADDILLTPGACAAYTAPWDLSGGSYLWWIQARRAAGQDAGPWSAAGSFKRVLP